MARLPIDVTPQRLIAHPAEFAETKSSTILQFAKRVRLALVRTLICALLFHAAHIGVGVILSVGYPAEVAVLSADVAERQ